MDFTDPDLVYCSGSSRRDSVAASGGSMRSKVEAAAIFAKTAAGTAAIGRSQDATMIVAGTAGTIIATGR
jgi:carbamate kinase